MLRMDPFTVEHPRSVDDVIALLQQHPNAKVCAGGTDLLPNIKHGLHEPDVVVHLGRVDALRGLHNGDNELVIGALTTLHALHTSDVVKRHAPGLAMAASLVAGPQLRRMGTLGGNLCLDTRCLFYNQSYFWRESLGFCLKKDGVTCHVIPGGQRCVAAASNDTATMLLCLDATLDLVGKSGARTVTLADFYVGNGARNTILEDGELLVRVHVPKVGAGLVRHEGYAKLRHRDAIDFPMLSVGVRFDVDSDHIVRACKSTVSALGSKPNVLVTDSLVGRVLDDALVDELAALAHKKCTPLKNITDEPSWRKEMVPVFVKRACAQARGERLSSTVDPHAA
jgi:4-hydroxybenzoyl-CoA reductase subunit beta